MPKYQVICDSRFKKYFGTELQQADTSSSPYSDLALFRWETDQTVIPYMEKVRQLNEEKISCILHEVVPIKAVFFDMDATVIGQETIVEIARVAGSSQQVEAITSRAMAGTLDFREALKLRVETLQGLHVGELEKVHERLTINPGLETFCQACKERDIKLFLISGGFQRFAKRVAEKLGFSGFMANCLEIKDNILTGNTIDPIVDSAMKKTFLLETCKTLAIDPRECLAVGDGANDLPMLKEAGICVGYSPKPILMPYLHGAMFENHLPLIDIINILK